MEVRTALCSARVVDVRREMFGEVVGAREAFAARLAVVGALARVYAQVARQVALAPERAPAEQTHKRSLTCVLPYVQLQVLLGPHALAAERASEPPLPVSLPLVVLHEAEDGVRARRLELAVGPRIVLRAICHGTYAGERDGYTPSTIRAVFVSPVLALGARRPTFCGIVDGHYRVGRAIRIDRAVLLGFADRIYRRCSRFRFFPLHRQIYFPTLTDDSFVGAGDLIDVVRRVRIFCMQTLERMVESVFFEGF